MRPGALLASPVRIQTDWRLIRLRTRMESPFCNGNELYSRKLYNVSGDADDC